MNKWNQGIAASLAVVWITWVSHTLWNLNEKVTRLEVALVPRTPALSFVHPQPDRLASSIHP